MRATETHLRENRLNKCYNGLPYGRGEKRRRGDRVLVWIVRIAPKACSSPTEKKHASIQINYFNKV